MLKFHNKIPRQNCKKDETSNRDRNVWTKKYQISQKHFFSLKFGIENNLKTINGNLNLNWKKQYFDEIYRFDLMKKPIANV